MDQSRMTAALMIRPTPVATEQVETVEIEAVTPESEIPAAAESQKTQPEQANNK